MVYQYTRNERIIMAIINSLSNLPIGPTIFLLKYQKKIFSHYVGYFSMLVSIMYHICESLDIKIFLEQLKWHELDNIGAIYCFSQMTVPLTKFNFDLNYITKKNYIIFYIILLFQQRGPWVLANTFMPLIIDFSIALCQIVLYGLPKYNNDILIKAGICMVISLIFFYKGLDDLNDYLRIWHSLWHLFIGITSFYLLQIQDKKYVGFYDILKFGFGSENNFNEKNVQISLNANEL